MPGRQLPLTGPLTWNHAHRGSRDQRPFMRMAFGAAGDRDYRFRRERKRGAKPVGRGAGMLAPGGEIERGSPLGKMAVRSLALYPEFVRELEEESGERIDYRNTGAIELACSDAEAEALQRRASRQRELGIQSEECRYRGFTARYYPADALVNPRDLTRSLAAACRRKGVTIPRARAGSRDSGRW